MFKTDTGINHEVINNHLNKNIYMVLISLLPFPLLCKDQGAELLLGANDSWLNPTSIR